MCKHSGKHSVNICSINICGLSSRSKLMLDKYNDEEKFDIVAVQETGTVDAHKLKLSNMKVMPDTNSAKNRGATTYVRSEIPCTKLPEISKISKNLDSAWCLAVINNQRIIIGNVYVKLNHHTAIQETIQMIQAAQVEGVKLKTCGIIVVGDFNSRHSLWGDTVNNDYGQQLVDQLDHTAYSIVNPSKPTFLCENGQSFIDLMIVSNTLVGKVKSTTTDDEIELFSGAPLRGHVPLIAEIDCNRNHVKPTVKEKLDVSAVNWEQWSEDLEKQLEDDKSEVARYKNPNQLWKYFEGTVEKITEKHSVKKRSCMHSKPYWTADLAVSCKKMREARKVKILTLKNFKWKKLRMNLMGYAKQSARSLY